ncbi:MAG: TIM-barrel domain-containing protein, partial [bacterium]
MFGFRVENDRLVWEKKHHILKLEPCGVNSIRVRATVLADFANVPSALIDVPKIKPLIEIHDNTASITNGKLKVVVGIDGRIQFVKISDGTILLEEPTSHFLFPDGRKFQSRANDLYQIDVTFEANEGERFYGLGQHRHGLLNQKGCVIDLLQRNCEVAIPFLISSRGYGFLWNNPGMGRVELAENHTRWTAYGSRQIDYVVFAGDSCAEILERYVDATGHAPEIPEWATGFWQCKLRYRTQDELLSIAHEYRERGLPLSVIVIDFFHWPKMGDWRFDGKEWPDPSGMVKELDEIGVKVMVSVWPAVNRNSENFEEMKDRGLL